MDNSRRDSRQPLSGKLSAFAAELSLNNVPAAVTDRARHLMLDALGCALAARGEPFAGVYTRAIMELSGSPPPGTGRAVIGHDLELPMRDAAMLNGVLAHGLDFDDTHAAGIAHLSVAVLPAVLALGAEHSFSGARALRAFIVGLEAGARIAGAAPGLFHDRGFHPTVTVGVFASAIAASALLGLDPDAIQRAQGFALSMACGTLQFVEDGAWTKRLHPGWAASSGLACAILAQHPIPTPVESYEGRFGLYRAFLGEERMSKIDLEGAGADLGHTWLLMDIAVKPFPVCHFNHACADAAIALHAILRRSGIALERIRRVDAYVPEGVMPAVCIPIDTKRAPATDYEAKFSIPYAIASGLLRGHLELADLASSAISDPQARSIMDRVYCVADLTSTFPLHYSGEVVLTLDDGSTLAQREAINRGHPERPLENEAVRAKYRANANLWFGENDSRKLEDFVLALELHSDMRAIEPLLAPPFLPQTMQISEIE